MWRRYSSHFASTFPERFTWSGREHKVGQQSGFHLILTVDRHIFETSPGYLASVSKRHQVDLSVQTVEKVLALMKDANWVHFAYYGIQYPENLTISGLCPADQRRLKLSDVISFHISVVDSHFSACRTGTSNNKPSDMAIHIDVELSAGYEGAIGRMWPIKGVALAHVAKWTY
ncbi:hypothetical protein J3R82DRAFT_9447 [Butyriboletus roseoflavus]|nr:hypothetical protein J3R82DRAFT_9447 [Butyriboletus roseoflavus]